MPKTSEGARHTQYTREAVAGGSSSDGTVGALGSSQKGEEGQAAVMGAGGGQAAVMGGIE